MFNGRDMEEPGHRPGPARRSFYVPVKEYLTWSGIFQTFDLQRSLVYFFIAEGEDNLKKMQLMELAILNGTYRDANVKTPTAAFPLGTPQAPRIITGPTPVLPPT
ncbi:protein quaking-B-like isoform X1, partial [Lates japonicus]